MTKTKQTFIMTDDSFQRSYTMQKALSFTATSPYDPPAWEYGKELKCVSVSEAMTKAEKVLWKYHLEADLSYEEGRHYVLWTPKQKSVKPVNIRKHQEMWQIAMDVFVKFRQEGKDYTPDREISQLLEQPRNLKFYPAGYIFNQDTNSWEYHAGS